jgi:O-antigen/teichoic acid export membrane protein
MDISNSIKILSTFLQAIFSFIALHQNFGILGLIYSNGIAVIISGVLSLVLVKIIFPDLQIGLRFFRIRVLGSSLSYSLQIQLSSIINLGFDPLNRILISRYISIDALAIYDISNKIVSQIIAIFNGITIPLMPASAEVANDANQNEKVATLHKSFLRVFYRFGFFCFILIIAYIPSFITLWLGSSKHEVSQTIIMLLSAWVFGILSIPSYVIFRGIGKPQFNIYNQIILICINFLFACLLIPKYGYFGIISSMVLGLIGAGLYTIIKFFKYIGMSISDLEIKEGIIYFLLSGLLSTISFFLYKRININNYFVLALSVTFTGIIYLLIIFFMNRNSQNNINTEFQATPNK